MVRFENVSKQFGSQRVLNGIDLELETGKTFVFIGPSGCGKSTLIRLIIGLIEPDEGSVFVADELVTPKNAIEIRRRIGYVIQSGGLFPHMTGRTNIGLMAKLSDWDDGKIESRILELAELTQLQLEALDRYPAQLSGGQQQRIGLMRALMLDPDILLLDEPLGALDPLVRSDLQVDLREIFRTLNKTVIMVTHDLHEAAYFADETILIRDGQIAQRGKIDEFLNKPANDFVKRFVQAQRTSLESE